ncbi:MAG: hypothetical protein LBQ54_00940 [Planctomycetaceae bacterium]|nr:hypothetical protein [Planctomycetaceae bacterium]
MMATGARKERWNHTAVLCSLVFNAHRDPKKSRGMMPDDFMPDFGDKEVEYRSFSEFKENLKAAKESL